MSISVVKPGILTTVQDLGRAGHRALGINPSGVMDRAAARILNTLLGNTEHEAVLEMHFPAGEFVFEAGCSFAVGGADFGAMLNDVVLRNWGVAIAKKGDRLAFTKRDSGSRAYLTVAGSFDLEPWLGSKSTNLAAGAGGYEGRPLKAGDRIGFARPNSVLPVTAGPSILPRYSRFPTVRVVAGAEFDLLTAVSERDLVNEGFTVTRDSNRMGYRLQGPPLYLLDQQELVSSAVTFGTVQLLPDGQLIVLMADHQTTGGYPRVANVIEADLPLLAQLSPGDGLSFHLVEIDEAEGLADRFEHDLRILKVGVSISR